MPDITMCEGGSCPKRDQCYRFRAVPSEYRQSYFQQPPWDRWHRCDHFWQIQPGDRLVPLPDNKPDERVEIRHKDPPPDDGRVAHPPKEERKHRHRKEWGIKK